MWHKWSSQVTTTKTHRIAGSSSGTSSSRSNGKSSSDTISTSNKTAPYKSVYVSIHVVGVVGRNCLMISQKALAGSCHAWRPPCYQRA